MKKLLTVLFTILLLNICIKGQSHYRPGFIITKNSDTIIGLIDYRGEINNAKGCFFKTEENAEPKEYTPSEIQGYRFINDKFYISKEISINGNKENIFLEFLMDGIVDLYCYIDAGGTHYFIQKGNEPLTELKITETEFYKDNILYSKRDKNYVGYLKNVFVDAPEIQKKAELVELNRKALIKISTDYHNYVCKDSLCVVYEKSLPPIKVEIGPIIGYGQYSAESTEVMDRSNLTSINFHHYYCNFETSYTPNIGIYAKIPLPYTSNKLIVQYEGVVNLKKFSSDYKCYYWNGEEETLPFTIQSANLSHYLFLRYDPLKGKISPFFQIGMQVSHGLSTHYSEFENDYLSHSVDDFPFPNRIYYGLSAGLGLSYRFNKHREIFLRFVYTRDFEMFYYFGVTEMNITLGIPVFIL